MWDFDEKAPWNVGEAPWVQLELPLETEQLELCLQISIF
jgi:hypothetical protein